MPSARPTHDDGSGSLNGARENQEQPLRQGARCDEQQGERLRQGARRDQLGLGSSTRLPEHIATRKTVMTPGNDAYGEHEAPDVHGEHEGPSAGIEASYYFTLSAREAQLEWSTGLAKNVVFNNIMRK
jgi:hypothetical protein